MGNKIMDYRLFGKLVYQTPRKRLEIRNSSGRFYLVDSQTGDKLNELINGADALEKYHGGEYVIWINNCINRNFDARIKERNYHQTKADENHKLAAYFAELKGLI